MKTTNAAAHSAVRYEAQVDNRVRLHYLQLKAHLEAREGHWANLEKALRATVGHLCLAARGRTPQLDQALRGLLVLLRQDPTGQRLKEGLEPLRAAAATIQPVDYDQDTSSETQAFSDAADQATLAYEQQIHEILVAMFNNLNSVPELVDVLPSLPVRSPSELTDDELAGFLQQLTGALRDRHTQLVRERRQLEELLQRADAGLSDVTTFLMGQEQVHRDAEESNRQLNALMVAEISDLSAEGESASALQQLQVSLSTRLASIQAHLASFNAREASRTERQQHTTHALLRRISELEAQSRALKQQLSEKDRALLTDALTNIPNRAAYDDRLQFEYTRWKRVGDPVAVLALDIDFFKKINDSYGHRAGDRVLQRVARYFADSIRETDFVARYGGEEFVILLINTNAEQALSVANKIREGIPNLGFHFGDLPVTITVSCGISAFSSERTAEEAFGRADAALYAAKAAGRNCCKLSA